MTEQKRCVTNLSLATTSVHVVLETPASGKHTIVCARRRRYALVVLYITAACFGPQLVHQMPSMCSYQIGVHFMGIIEASIPFYVYVLFRCVCCVVVTRANRNTATNSAN